MRPALNWLQKRRERRERLRILTEYWHHEVTAQECARLLSERSR